MTPSRLSSALRLIASRIDASRRPARHLVARELRKVIAAVGNDVTVYYTLRPDADEAGMPEDDGTLTVELEKIVGTAGGIVEEWDAGSGLVISCPSDKVKSVEDAVWGVINEGAASDGLVNMMRMYQFASRDGAGLPSTGPIP